LGVALAAAVLLLTGCYGNDQNMAAKVGQTVITETEVTQVAQNFVDAMPDSGYTVEQLRTTVVNWEVGIQLVKQSLGSNETLDAAVTDDAKASFIAQYSDVTALSTNPETASWTQDLAAYGVGSAALGATGMNELAQELGVELNPRYGEWNPATGQITGTGSLSTPFPTATAATAS
jgi:hypothetical protein